MATYVPLLVQNRKESSMELGKEQLLQIEGGINLTGTLISAFTKAINSLLDVGRSLGTAIRRINSGQICQF